MADRYLITFDIKDGAKADYDAVLDAVAHNNKNGTISSYCRPSSLTTTYAIKSNSTIKQITNMFYTATPKPMNVIVVKVIDSDWNISPEDAKTLTEHKF